MPLNADEVVVGSNGQAYVAPVGTTAPTDSGSALDTDFVELGYISEDGATITDNKDVENIGAWQSFYPLRRIITGRELNVGFALRQWNGDTVKLAFGGGTVAANGAGEWEYTPPDPEELDERALVLDWQDGDKHYRLYVPRGIVTETVETNLTRSSAADLPITYGALPVDDVTPVYTLLTDDPSFSGGS